MLEFSFMDMVNKATYHEMLPEGHKDPVHKQGLLSYRMALRKAQRFVLDDDAVRMICRLAQDTSRLSLWSVLSRLPYDTMWVEYDFFVRGYEHCRITPKREPFDETDVSRCIGYLFEKDEKDGTRWLMTEFLEVDGKVAPQPTVFVFDPEGSDFKPVKGSSLLRQPTLSSIFKRPIIPLRVTIDDINVDLSEELMVDPEFSFFGVSEIIDGKIAIAAEFTSKIGAVINPLWAKHLNGGKEEAGTLLKCLFTDATERSGALRWVICMLAAINGLPHSTKLIQGRKGFNTTRAGPIKYLDHHTISINIPKGRDYRYTSRELSKAGVAAHRAWHRVRGHWRIVEHGKRNTMMCKHEPTMVENGLAMCNRCEMLIRWIHDHERGTPELGMVDHDYLVKTR